MPSFLIPLNVRLSLMFALFSIVLPVAAEQAPLSEKADLKFTGYYKNLLIRSRTWFPLTEPYTLDFSRLRLELQGKLSAAISTDIRYNNEAMLGDYLNSRQFALQKRQEPDNFFDGENIYIDHAAVFMRHRLDRAHLEFATRYADVRVGRQRIAWGTGRFWNPLDLINPFNPLAIERNERAGVDAVMMTRHLGALSRMSLVYAPEHPGSDSSTALYLRSNWAEFDFSVMAGQFRVGRVMGLDFSGQIHQMGIHCEAAYTWADRRASFARAVVGGDYTFANTLSLGVEYYFNGQGTAHEADYIFNLLFSGASLNLARHYLGIYAGYDFTPLLRWNHYAIININDGSYFLAPSLVYSVITNVDWSVGFQGFGGETGSEYDAFQPVYYTQLQWFF